jgi:hypothetical protein
MGHGGFEGIRVHAPGIGAVVEQLRKRVTEVAVLRTGLELDDHDLAVASQADQIRRAGGKTCLATDHHHGSVKAELLEGKELGVSFQLLL